MVNLNGLNVVRGTECALIDRDTRTTFHNVVVLEAPTPQALVRHESEPLIGVEEWVNHDDLYSHDQIKDLTTQ